MGYIIGIGCSIILASFCAFFWVKNIDYMKENHPDYKGDDFFGYENDNSDVDYLG